MPEFSTLCFDISKLASFLLQSHPTCCGPDLTRHPFSGAKVVLNSHSVYSFALGDRRKFLPC